MNKLSIRSRACVAALPSKGKSLMPKKLGVCALVLGVCGAPVTYADATLTYELSGPETEKTVKQFSLARFFARIDGPAVAERYLIFQAGKFFPVYAVDKANQTYTQLTPVVTPRLGPVSPSAQVADAEVEKNEDRAESEQAGVDAPIANSGAQARADDNAEIESETSSTEAAGAEDSSGRGLETASAMPATEPGPDGAASGAPQGKAPAVEASDVPSAKSARRTEAAILKPTKKTRTVAGIECRVVHELVDGEAVIEHCMANSARLRITDRELITLSRLFGMARNMEYGWLGVGTKDEEFVSVQSRDLRDDGTLELTSVSTQPLEAGYLRIPKTYKLVESDTEAK